MRLHYLISGTCGLAILAIISALIFKEDFRSSMLVHSENQISLGSFSVQGIVLVVLLALLIIGLIAPLMIRNRDKSGESPYDKSSDVILSGDKENKEKISSELTRQIKNYFHSQNWIEPAPGTVMAEARGIVRRFENEPDIFRTVQEEIEERKKNDTNRIFANELASGLKLVNILGLSPETRNKNEIFLTMELPAVSPREMPH